MKRWSVAAPSSFSVSGPSAHIHRWQLLLHAAWNSHTTVTLQSAVFVKPCITAGWLHTDSRSFSGHTVFVSLQYYYTTLCFQCLHVTLVTLFMFGSDFSLCSSSVITAHWLLFVLLMLNLCWCQRRKSRDWNVLSPSFVSLGCISATLAHTSYELISLKHPLISNRVERVNS